MNASAKTGSAQCASIRIETTPANPTLSGRGLPATESSPPQKKLKGQDKVMVQKNDKLRQSNDNGDETDSKKNAKAGAPRKKRKKKGGKSVTSNGAALTLVCDAAELQIHQKTMADPIKYAAIAGQIMNAKDCQLHLDPASSWSQEKIALLAWWLLGLQTSPLFVVAGKSYRRLPLALAALARQCKTRSRKLRIVAAIKIANKPIIGDSSKLAAAVGDLQALHIALELHAPSKSALTKEIKDLARLSNGPIAAMVSEEMQEVFLGDARVRGLVMPDGYTITHDGIFLQGSAITTTPVVVVGIFNDANTGELHFSLLIRRGADLKECCRAASTVLCSRMATKLAGKHVDISSETAQAFVIYLQVFLRTNMDALPCSDVVRQLGHHTVIIDLEGKSVRVPIFLYGQEILVPAKFEKYRDLIESRVQLEGRDDGENAYIKLVSKAGEWKAWKAMLIKLQQFPIVVFAMMCGLVPMLLESLGLKGFTLSLAYTSSSGKTSTLRFVASLFGSSQTFDDGLILDFNATSNAIQRFLVVNRSLPTFVDDTTHWIDKLNELQQLVYEVEGGKGKSRATLTGAETSPAFWTVLFVTGETPLLELCTQQGAIGRVIEFRESPFGEESKPMAKQLHELLTVASANYGWVGRKFAQYLLNHPKFASTLHQRLAELQAEERDLLPVTSGVAMRISRILAVIRLTCEVARRALKLPVDFIDPVVMLRSKIYEGVTTPDKFDKALENVSSYVQENEVRFKSKSGGSDGYLEVRGDRTCLFILRPVLERILNERCKLGIDAVLPVWKKRGVLIHKNDKRFSVRKRFGGRMQTMIGIRLSDQADFFDHTVCAAKKVKQPSKNKGEKGRKKSA